MGSCQLGSSVADAEEWLAEALPADVTADTEFLVLNEKAAREFSRFCFGGPETLDDWLRRVADAHYHEEYDEELHDLLDDDS